MSKSPLLIGSVALLSLGLLHCGDDDTTATTGTPTTSAAGGGSATSTTTSSNSSASGGAGTGGNATGGSAQGGGGAMSNLYQPDDGPTHESGTVVDVCSEAEILNAIDTASAGDVITVCPGTFSFNQLIRVEADGTDSDRIFLRAAQPNTVTFNLSHIENFKISGKFWIFENIKYVGVCTNGTDCEHAFHIVADADDVIFRRNEVVDFASHVKLNAEVVGAGPAKSFPDRTWFIENFWHNTKYIPNSAPHNILNLDGGQDHVARRNVFADFNTSPTSGRSASAVYPKASARGMLIEQNLIVCEKQRTDGETTRGIQLGDGAPASICDGDTNGDGNGDCDENGQSQLAIVRNNIVIGCNNGGSAAGIMVVSDNGSKIYNNTVVEADPRNAVFYQGHADHDSFFRFNVFERGFNTNAANRPIVESDNHTPDASAVDGLFNAHATGDFALADGTPILGMGPGAPEVTHDFCGYPRGASPDLGAIEYSTSHNGTPCAAIVKALYDTIP